MINYFVGKSKSRDVIPMTVGEHETPKGHSFGPHVRDCVFIHMCLSGRGVLHNERGAHPVRAGELFVIREGELTTYTADENDPWHYVWISFMGHRAAEFSEAPDVFRTPEGLAERMMALVHDGVSSPDIFISVIYEIMHYLLPKSAEPEDKLAEIRRFIKFEYMKNVTAGGIAKSFGFDRTYLFRIFKERYGVSIKSYITDVRMSHARELLLSGHRVCDAAYMVGYRDEFNFSKAYKKYFGYPPKKTGESYRI